MKAEELAAFRRQFEARDFDTWLKAEEDSASAQLSADELEAARKAGVSPITFLKSKRAPLEGAALRKAQEDVARKLGTTLDPEDDRPVAFWTSGSAREAALDQAEARGPAALAALLAAISENEKLIAQRKAPTVRVPREAL